MPDFANPTGETMTVAAREALLDLASELGIAIIEDTAYEALRFEGETVTPILALDIKREGHIDKTRTVYCGTFSKTIAPAYRVGWICAAAPILSKLVLVKQAADLHSSTINQMVMHALASGHYDRAGRGGAARSIAAVAMRCSRQARPGNARRRVLDEARRRSFRLGDAA